MIRYRDREISPADGETVLAALLAAGLPAAHGCRAGACQACLMRAVSGEIPAAAQRGLKPALVAQGYVLACAMVPTGDVVLVDADDPGLEVSAEVVGKDQLGASVMQVRLSVPDGFRYTPGMFVNVVRADRLIRSYSLASVPELDDTLELHVRIVPGGRMSTWVRDELGVGDRVTLRGPAGSCCYVPGDREQPMLLVATGTGLAPVWGILRDALQQGHTGTISLYHGGRTEGHLYHGGVLAALAAEHPQLSVVRCVSQGDAPSGMASGRASDLAMARHPDLKGVRVFVAGNPQMVSAIQRAAFLRGASLAEIHCDAHVTADTSVDAP